MRAPTSDAGEPDKTCNWKRVTAECPACGQEVVIAPRSVMWPADEYQAGSRARAATCPACGYISHAQGMPIGWRYSTSTWRRGQRERPE